MQSSTVSVRKKLAPFKNFSWLLNWLLTSENGTWQFFWLLHRKLNNMDGVKQQDSTPQNDSTLGFKWIKKITQNIV
jgi:hypothetical protein